MAERRWRVRLSEAAERDFLSILAWTAEHFGRRQAVTYRRTLVAALIALHGGPLLPDSRPRADIRSDLRALHVARRGRRGRHFIVYRSDEAGVIEVVRILHDSMDIAGNLPS